MRLIDAEATKEKLFVELKGLEPIPEDIDEMPTIEAVPLSFIREEVERLDKCKLTELADYMRNVLKYYNAVQRGEETW